MKSRNAGFTLVELIVVIVIIGVLAALVGLSVSTVRSAQTKRAAAGVDALISKCRTGALAKSGEVSLTLSVNGGRLIGEYTENDVLKSTDSFPLSGTAVSYTLGPEDGSGTSYALSERQLTLAFDRSTGGQKTQEADGPYCTSIRFDAGKSYEITLIPATGAHELS